MKSNFYTSSKKTIRAAYVLAVVIMVMSLLLSGCGAAAGVAGPGSAQPVQAASEVPAAPTQTPLPKATRKPRPTATPTEDPVAVRVEQSAQAVRDYFAVLEAGEAEQAAEQVSTYSLMVFGMTRGDIATALRKQRLDGARYTDLQVGEVKPFDNNTTLVSVTYTLTAGEAKEAREELWPVRWENDTWRYNWENLIDFRSLQVKAQTTSGVTVKPVQMNRFSDRIQLLMLVQNRTNSPVVFGQKNEVLGTFHFGDQAIEADQTQVILNPLRSVPDVKLEVKGLWERYPEKVEIRKWKTYQVDPWYVFQLQ